MLMIVLLMIVCLSSFENLKFKDELHITLDELKALKDLSSRKDIIIQKVDKGDSVVIFDKSDYIKMTEMLSDIGKFKKRIVKPGKEVNLLLKHEDKLVSFMKGIKNILEKIYIKASVHRVHNQVSCMGHLKYVNPFLMAFLN